MAADLCVGGRNFDRRWQRVRTRSSVLEPIRADRTQVPDVQLGSRRLFDGLVLALHCVDRPTLHGRILQLRL